MKKYEVLQVGATPGKPFINSKELEEQINSKAEEGWEVIFCTESNVVFKGEELKRLIIILEKAT